MKTRILVSIAVFLFSFNFIISGKVPIVAIFANANPDTSDEQTSDKVNVNYVRWLESSGAQAAVIHTWSTKDEIDDILSKANGVLFQGGARPFNLSKSWEKMADYILHKVIQLNKNGSYLPLWAACQGFELLHVLITGTRETLSEYRGWNYASPIVPVRGEMEASRMYSGFSDREIRILQQEAVTQHFHHLGISLETYNWRPELNVFFRPTTVGLDMGDKVYVATVEARDYPIYGVQFHPEKTPFDRKDSDNIPQSIDALVISQRYGQFFVNEVNKNENTMPEADRLKYDFINTFEEGNRVFQDGQYIYNKKVNPNVPEFLN